MDKLSNPVGELTVVPMILLRERPESKNDCDLTGVLGGREYGELLGVDLSPRLEFGPNVRGLEGVRDIFQP